MATTQTDYFRRIATAICSTKDAVAINVSQVLMDELRGSRDEPLDTRHTPATFWGVPVEVAIFLDGKTDATIYTKNLCVGISFSEIERG